MEMAHNKLIFQLFICHEDKAVNVAYFWLSMSDINSKQK